MDSLLVPKNTDIVFFLALLGSAVGSSLAASTKDLNPLIYLKNDIWICLR